MAKSEQIVLWTISKGLPDWSISPLTTNIKIGETGRVIISGTFTGLDTVQQSSPDGGQVSFLGLNGNQLSFKGTKAGTVAVIVYSKENKYYESDNRVFRVVVSKNKEDQNWYYSNQTIAVGMSMYIYREGDKISSATPELTIGDSNIISATINNSDGRLTITGKAKGTSTLTVKIPADENYNEHSNVITITVIESKKKNYVKIWNGSSWVNAIPYIYFDGSWHQSIAYVNDNGQWKETTV